MLKYSLCTSRFSDHSMVALSRKVKIPKARAKVVYRWTYKRSANDQFVEYVRNVDWNGVYSADDQKC